MNKKYIKRISLLLSLVMIFLVACGTPNKVETETDVKEPENVAVETETESSAIDMDEVLANYKYGSWVPFDEDLKQKKTGRDVVSENGIVSTQRFEASQIGAEIMEKGGNAIDAAVAAAFALGVAEPNASGLGGGGFMTFRDGETGKVVFIDFREVAPGAATEDMYLDEAGEVVSELSQRGGLSVAVPGEVAGLLYILDEYGTMSREEVIQPSIDLARDGFLASPKLVGTITDAYEVMTKYPELGEIYLDDGLPPEPGLIIKNEDLAKTLEIIVEKGRDGFYKGEVAQAIVDSANKYDGILTLEDLENYEIEIMEPVGGEYRGYEILSSPPPSSGGTHLIQILNILENYDVGAMDLYSAEYMHLFSEAFKIAYADRAEYMGDPKYVDVPINGLRSKEYAKVLSEKIDMEKAQTYEADDPWKYEGDSTTHMSVADKDGNMIGITKTINYYYGSGVVADGYGFILNNEMDDFSSTPGEANSIVAGKKPLSSMSPTVMLKDGQPFMVLGTPGGASIFIQIAQVISHVVDHGMPVQDAISMPRIRDGLWKELTYMDGIEQSEIDKLEEMGHATSHMPGDNFGDLQAIMYGDDGMLHGGADIYADGQAVGY